MHDMTPEDKAPTVRGAAPQASADAPFFDIHAHCVAVHGFSHTGRDAMCDPAQLLAHYDRLGVFGGALLPMVNPEAMAFVQSVEDILKMAADHPGRFVPFCNIDPRAMGNGFRSPLGDVLKFYRDKGCRGVGELCANLRFLDPRVQNLFKGAEEAGLPVTFHISPQEGRGYGLVDDAGLPQLEECLRRFPKLRFFGHSQTFWCEMAADPSPTDRARYASGPIAEEGAIPRLMRKYPNLYGDLSANSGANAIMRDRAYGIAFLNEFQDRLMFGLDICEPEAPRAFDPPLLKHLRELLAAGEISQAVFDKVARSNALRELGLGQ